MNTNTSSRLLLALSAIGLLFGGFFAVEELFIQPSFMTNDGLVWTLPLVTYIFLALASTGVSIVMASAELTGNEAVNAHKPVLLIAALSLLVGAFAALATEMGSPLNVFWLLLSPNLNSPIWWMGTLYSIELALLGIKLFALLSGKEQGRGHILTIATLAVAVLAALVLGSVFGTVTGREGFSGLDASLLTLLCALTSGAVLVPLLVNSTARHSMLQPGRILIGALSLLLVVKYVYLVRGSVPSEVSWVALWMPILMVGALASYRAMPVLAALIAMPTLLFIELSFVIQGQLLVLGPKQTWLGSLQSYAPNMAEMGILAFGCSVAYLCYFVLSRVLELKNKRLNSPA
mgnify:FL=1|tara:strand:+ start:618 stop:1658 length:1041 start_codon:yes stop_codon:yes gene_type:complete